MSLIFQGDRVFNGTGLLPRQAVAYQGNKNVFMSSPVIQRTVVINNPQGLHARPAELFARLALQFDSEIEVIREGHRVDAKSILHVLTLGAAQGTELTLLASGTDAEEALEALARLVDSDFANDETLSQESSG